MSAEQKRNLEIAAIIILSFLLGIVVASRPAYAAGTSISESAFRMANSLERIEMLLNAKCAKCPNDIHAP